MRIVVLVDGLLPQSVIAKRLPEVEQSLKRQGIDYRIETVDARGQTTVRLRQLRREESAELVAIFGDDGTIHDAVQAYMDDEGKAVKGPELSVLYGADFARSLQLSGAIDEAVARMRFGRSQSIDLGIVEARDRNGRVIRSVFVNAIAIGAGGLIDLDSIKTPRWLGDRVTFFVETLRALSHYRNTPMRLRVDGHVFYEGPIFNVAIANGAFFGGGMKIAPQAQLHDGLLDVVIFGDLSTSEVLSLTATIYDGSHLAQKGVTVGSGRVIEVEPVHPWSTIHLNADGELAGKLPARIHTLKGALSLRI